MSTRDVVVITGASAGVGRATTRRFAEAGADVGLIARGRDGLEAARTEVERCGRRACVAIADVASAEQVEAAAAEIERTLGPITIWVNNAMASVFAPVKDLRPEEIERVTDVTYLGVVYGTLSALRRMRTRNHGSIVQVGSTLAYRAIPIQAAYCAAKHAVRGFTDSLRCELMHEGSKVNLAMVHLPAVDTPQFDWALNRLPGEPRPLPPIFAPELAADAIVWAARHRRRELHVGGPVASDIWANKLSPHLLDAYLSRAAYEGQHTDTAADPDRPSNLWEPVPGDHGAHGRFSDRARHQSLQFWVTTHRRLLATAAATIGVSAAMWRGFVARGAEPSLVRG
jgi:NAD(P)-dependent dehydrogenase (short-subunit alcohol dehydrogenase family)